MAMFTHSKLNFIKFFLVFIVPLTSAINIAQTKEGIDIDSKAKELGITTTELQGILNSALRNSGSGDPQPEAITERFFTGQTAGDQFGGSVSTAGDVNGDGYSDIIVGAFSNDAGGNQAGRAYIYYGGISMDNIADVIMTGESAGDSFGLSVSTTGDVNGDGYSDVIVGAFFNDGGGNDAGRAYIYFGGTSMDNIADVTLTGEAEGDQFGRSVSTAGDVNGDGYSDVIVGAYNNDAGKAHIYFGGASMDIFADVTLTGEAAGDLFGGSVSTAGDVNGDGYSDVVVGAYLNDAGGASAGRAYIYFGDTSMDIFVDITMTGEAAGDQFGVSISTAGDVNGDGYSDIIVGANLNDAGGNDAGRAYIYFGGASMDIFADVTLTGEAAIDLFGQSVSTAGDVNGDGYSDVIVGAYLNSAGGNNAGRAYIYFGGTTMDNITDVIMTGKVAVDIFGISVSTAGDVNGDGYSDVIVGAPLNDTGGNNAGRAYLYLNSLTGLDIPDEFITGEAAGDQFGISVSIAGDVNGDGYSDFIVGAYFNDAGGNDAGRAYIYFGGTSMDNIADVTLKSVAAGDQFGISVSTAGDVNGDGYSDVIVGAYNNDAGRAFLYFGGTSMDNVADVTLTGEAAGDQFGISVSTADDVNGDGYSDVIVGAHQNDAGGSFAGRSYIYFGDTSMDNIADVIMTGEAAGDRFGISVSTAGDVNGDGYSDVIVGAPLNDAGGSNAGRSYIYFGGTPMDKIIIADVIITGEAGDQLGDQFGFSVSTAGDVNGDGYSDVIVGAYRNDAGGASAGRAYIYFGGISMDNTADVIMTGEVAFDSFGYSVSTAGDVNQDGYIDVIVGAYRNGVVRSFLYFGGTSMDNTADVIMIGEATDVQFGISVSTAGVSFGTSVSTAGDVNGDGYSDVIVGDFLNDAGGSDIGRSYLYLSSSPPIKPRIMSVKDVPFDQGGYVYVNFVRSGYDARGESNIITEYIIEMSNPPGENGFSWIQLGTVQPLQNPLYTFIAVTPNDSMTNNSGTYYFRVTARTSDPNQYWRSNIIYGHSVDNLAPLPVANFMSTLAGINPGVEVNLSWSPNTEADLKNYVLYRTDYPNADPDTLTPLAIVTDTTYLDTSPLSDTSYYYISAQDIHNNLSDPVSDQVGVVTSADTEAETIPNEFALYQNYPNPFNPSTSIQYAISSRQYVTLRIYNVLGKEISTLVNEEKAAGTYVVEFSTTGGATSLPSGIYFYKLQAESFVETKKMVLLK